MKEAEGERLLKTLANRRRLAILNALAKRKEANVSDISEIIHLSFTATSKHLTMLARVDILDKRQQSLEVYYFLGTKVPAVAKSVIAFL